MIKFVYFDLGGVVVKDFSGTSKWQVLKRDMGIKPEQDKEFDRFFDKYEGDVCLGRDLETLIPLMKAEFHLELPENYSFLNDFVDRFEKNQSLWSVIKRARRRYKIGLLTNMYPGMFKAIKDRDLMPKVRWEVIIDSSIEGVIKPEEKIYLLAQERAGVNSEEIFFVENSQGNVEAAKRLGWQTFLYDSSNPENSSKKLKQEIEKW